MWEYEDKAAFALLKELVYSTNTTEFCVARFNTNNLLLIGSFDLSYYHEAEFVFEDVFYIEIYTSSLSSPTLRFATADEIARYKHLELDASECLFALTSDSHQLNPVYFIGASKVKARRCMVYHYNRENLLAGEEIWTQN
jgi:hypothetical protein